MASSRADLEAAIELRQCAEARTLGRRRARSVAAVFGRNNLTRHARKQIDEALRAAGIETTPAILDCDRDDWLSLEVVGEPPLSDDLPSQIVTWHEFNWTGEGDDGPNGEWLRCLKDTLSHQRQFVWSGFKVAGLVTFSGWVRPGDGFFEGWGSLTRLRKPVDRVAFAHGRADRTALRWTWHQGTAGLTDHGRTGARARPLRDDPRYRRHACATRRTRLQRGADPLDWPSRSEARSVHRGCGRDAARALAQAGIPECARAPARTWGCWSGGFNRRGRGW
ncbi:MAG: hypothetical protein QOK16_2840 [Solirubrobacteraceae bacterium]|nr:hypothetical protein [Solirubrobacteraceae bacterium]